MLLSFSLNLTCKNQQLSQTSFFWFLLSHRINRLTLYSQAQSIDSNLITLIKQIILNPIKKFKPPIYNQQPIINSNTPMLTKNIQINLDCINILKGLAYSQMLLQDQRASLINSGYFNDYDAYSRIDIKEHGKITPNDIIEFLGVHRIAASEREAQYLIWNAGSSESFLTYEQFQLYMSNNEPQFFTKMQASVLSRNNPNNMSDEIMKSTTQRELSRLFEKEIEFYRTIQVLKEEFIKKYGYSFKNVISSIDREMKGNVAFDALIKFIHEHGVEFSVEEYQGLCRKIRAKNAETISFKELLRALSPFEPLSFPTYRKQTNIQKAMDYITDQVGKLNIDVSPVLQDPTSMQKAKKTGFQKVVDNFRSTANKGTNQTNKYFYDKNYYNQLRQYKTTFFDPNKRKYTNQNELIGPQYHDHFFSEYYLYLDERNKTEHYYNKFGKRYTFENPIAKVTEGRL